MLFVDFGFKQLARKSSALLMENSEKGSLRNCFNRLPFSPHAVLSVVSFVVILLVLSHPVNACTAGRISGKCVGKASMSE